jgi:hypothetical protein
MSFFQLLRSCQRISPGPRRFEKFRNTSLFYGEGLLRPHPTPKLEDHPFSAVRSCPPDLEAFSFISNLRTRHAMVTKDPPNMDYQASRTLIPVSSSWGEPVSQTRFFKSSQGDMVIISAGEEIPLPASICLSYCCITITMMCSKYHYQYLSSQVVKNNWRWIGLKSWLDLFKH